MLAVAVNLRCELTEDCSWRSLFLCSHRAGPELLQSLLSLAE